ncbi:hypothetical protein Gogos_016719, partial [Gossypium gossypioides]|nr:hypothetical protein [Gossypium gossypioides]
TRVVETDNTTGTCFDVHTGDLGSFVLHYSRVAVMLTIPIVDNNNQQEKSLAKVQCESPFKGEEMRESLLNELRERKLSIPFLLRVLGVRCQLVLLLMEVAGSEGVLDEVTFEADVWRELLEILLGFSSADHLVLMPSPPVSVSSPIREVLNDFHFSLLLLLLFFFYFIFVFKASGHRFTTATFRHQIEPPSLNNHETLIVASPHRVERLDHLDLSTVA